MNMTTHELNLEEQIDSLIKGPQYALPQAEKSAALLPLLRAACLRTAEGCPAYARFLQRLGGDPAAWSDPAEIPALPVSMFKQFALSAVPPAQVVRELHSSSTTGQFPSRIFLDKTTAFRQARALAAVLKEHIGGQRRPYLVLDAPEAAGSGEQITARGAAIRGIGNYASTTVYAMRQAPGGELALDVEAVRAFADEHGDGPVLLFGFTFMVWTRFLQEAERLGVTFHLPAAKLLHSGGWKKLAAQAVAKEEFSARVASVLGCPNTAILDFYGMVEQVGTVFVDCEAGNKHAPAFADILIRAPYTLAPVAPGEEGIIEVMSVLPASYPGQVLLTEDRGCLLGIDDCPCGRQGSYFRFTSRVERAEVRGCGDTFAQTRELR